MYIRQNIKKDDIFKILIIGGSQASLFFSENLKFELFHEYIVDDQEGISSPCVF